MSASEFYALWLLRSHSIDERVKEEFSLLNVRQLNWKSNDKSWSIGQCLDHLIVSNQRYFPILDGLVNKNHRMSFWERYNPLAKYTGKKMVESLGPTIIKPFQAPKLFAPSPKPIRATIVNDFLLHQDQLRKKVKSVEHIDPEKIFVSSPAAELITYSLKDCLLILNGHEERHILQAQKIMQSNSFAAI